ncbi:MAG: hypothetical protein JXR22_07060 [Prolixibacteraceae bacterium]|nr:hypothetical protein [Prolixibacteraceae bacterium]
MKLYKNIPFISVLIIYTLFCTSCNLILIPDDPPNTEINLEIILDTTLNVTNSPATVTLPQGLSVTIPQGLTSEVFTLTVSSLDQTPEVPDEFNFIRVFDVKLSFANEFAIPIKIRFDLTYNKEGQLINESNASLMISKRFAQEIISHQII